jgi:hypothetical protein
MPGRVDLCGTDAAQIALRHWHLVDGTNVIIKAVFFSLSATHLPERWSRRRWGRVIDEPHGVSDENKNTATTRLSKT